MGASRGVTGGWDPGWWQSYKQRSPAGTERETKGLRTNRTRSGLRRRRRRKRNKFKNRSWPIPRWSTRTAETEARRTAPVAAAAAAGDKIKRRGMYARACTPYAGRENSPLAACVYVCMYKLYYVGRPGRKLAWGPQAAGPAGGGLSKGQASMGNASMDGCVYLAASGHAYVL